MKSTDIELDRDTHVYTVGGREVPGVTDILTNLGIIDTRWFTEQVGIRNKQTAERARDRGIYVHDATQFLDEGCLNWGTLDPELKPYLEAYQKFLRETGIEIHLIEHHVYCKTLEYCGTLDRTGWLPGKHRKFYVLIDIKTGTPQPWTALQTMAYRHALLTDPLENTPAARYALHLKPNGNYSFKPYTDHMDAARWISCMNVYNYKKKIGRLAA